MPCPMHDAGSQKRVRFFVCKFRYSYIYILLSHFSDYICLYFSTDWVPWINFDALKEKRLSSSMIQAFMHVSYTFYYIVSWICCQASTDLLFTCKQQKINRCLIACHIWWTCHLANLPPVINLPPNSDHLVICGCIPQVLLL